MAIEVYDDNGPQTTDNGGDVYSEQDPQVTVHEADGTTASDGTTGGATASTNVSKSNEATATTAPDAPEGATDRQEGEQERQAKNKRQIDDAVMGYDAQISMLDAEAVRLKPETDEQRRKRERREKSKRIIAAVGDGLSALGNLYFTSQYAPNMYNGGLQRATDARIERAKKEREDNNERYLQFSLRSGALKNDRARTVRDLEAQQEARRIAQQKHQWAEQEHKWKEALQPEVRRELSGKATKAEQEAEVARWKAKYAPELEQARVATEVAHAGAYDAQAANSHASARAHNRSNPMEFSAWDEDGREHKFSTQKAADDFAKAHGTWQEADETETTEHGRYDQNGNYVTGKISTKTKKRGYRARPSQGKMPGVE